MEFFDSHAHYNDEKFNLDRDALLPCIYEAGITKMVSAGYSLDSSKKGIELAKQYGFIYTTCGISPNDIPNNIQETIRQIEEIKELANNFNKVVAIGEIGLDYYWNKENKEQQQEVFIRQIEIANVLELPIVIHTREAVSDTIDILKYRKKCKKTGVFHCCPFNRELVKEALKLDFYISFAGPTTFKNAKNANEIIQMVPEDRMLIETDSPYLAPEPNRGTRNDSRNVKWIAQKIAEVKGVPIEVIAKNTYENAKKIFEIS